MTADNAHSVDPTGALSADYEREEWRALATADTLHLLPTEALIATIKHLAERLLAEGDDDAGTTSSSSTPFDEDGNPTQKTGNPGTDGHATWCPVPHPDEHEGTCLEQLIEKTRDAQ